MRITIVLHPQLYHPLLMLLHSNASTKAQQNYYYYNEYHEGILEIAEGFLNILLNHMTMVTLVKGE